MPGIVIQANFDLMQEVPLDSRLVATNSLDRDAIQYKYAGMKVYQEDINRTWTWNGTGWDAEGSGIYGGSGSLIGDTFINMGSVSTALGSQSNYLVYRTDTTAATEAYIYNGFVRHTSAIPSVLGTEFIQQHKYFDGSNLYNAAHISFNPMLGGNDVVRGGLAFHTGNSNNVFERMRITGGGNVGIGTNDPKSFLQIGTTSASTSSPLVFHNSDSAVIGHNWYLSSSNAEQFFDVNKASTKLVQSSGTFLVQNRLSGQQPGDYTTTLFTTGANGGRVGVKTTSPIAVLDVNGDINGRNSITGLDINGGTVSSSNRVRGKRFDFTNLSNTSMTTGFSAPGPDDNFILTIRGTQSFRSNGNANFLFGDTYFYDSLLVNKNLDVVGIVDINGNLTVKGTSSITNFEPSTQLVPTLAYKHTLADFTTLESLSSFTYSFTAYRIGALVNIDVFVETNSSISVGNQFWGIMFKFDNERFKPVNSSYGHGTGGKSYPADEFYPLNFEIFQTDPTSGSAPAVTANEFYLRLRTTRISSSQGDGFRTGTSVPPGTKFRGTITYKSGDISTTSTSVPPTVISLPTPSTQDS